MSLLYQKKRKFACARGEPPWAAPQRDLQRVSHFCPYSRSCFSKTWCTVSVAPNRVSTQQSTAKGTISALFSDWIVAPYPSDHHQHVILTRPRARLRAVNRAASAHPTAIRCAPLGGLKNYGKTTTRSIPAWSPTAVLTAPAAA